MMEDKPTPPPCRLICECGAERNIDEPSNSKDHWWVCRLFSFLFGKP